jgi:hypothetical protein
MSFWYAAQAAVGDTNSVAIQLFKAFAGKYERLTTFWANKCIALFQGGVSTASSLGPIVVSNKALTSNVATLTTSSAHGLTAGQVVAVQLSPPDASFDGTYTVASTPTSTTFTYAKTATNVTSVSSGGAVAIDNYFFSCTFSDLYLNGYRVAALDTLAVNAANTGSVFTNLYTRNGPVGPAEAATGPALKVESCDEITFNQVNVESANFTGTAGVLVNGSQAVFNGLHFEGDTFSSSGAAPLIVYGSGKAIVNGMTVHNSTFPSGGADSIVQGGATADVIVDGMRWGNGNTVAASTLTLVKDQDGTGSFHLRGADTPGAFTGFVAGAPAIVDINRSPVAVAYNSGGLSITTTNTALTWDSETLDTHGMHSTSTNTERLTCVVPGVYALTAHLACADAASTTSTAAKLNVNGSSVAVSNHIFQNTANYTIELNKPVRLNVGDYVTVSVVRVGGGSDGAISGTDSYLSAHLVG